MRYLIASVSIIAMFAFCIFIMNQQRKEIINIKKENEKLYQDNKKMITILDGQQKDYNTLIAMGWSKDRVDDFIANGCLMYLQVEAWK